MKRMGMTIMMETEDFEGAAEFIEQFGDFARTHAPIATFEINQEPVSMQEAGATQLSTIGVPRMDDDSMVLTAIDTPMYDISRDPGRFAFEEEG